MGHILLTPATAPLAAAPAAHAGHRGSRRALQTRQGEWMSVCGGSATAARPARRCARKLAVAATQERSHSLELRLHLCSKTGAAESVGAAAYHNARHLAGPEADGASHILSYGRCERCEPRRASERAVATGCPVLTKIARQGPRGARHAPEVWKEQFKAGRVVKRSQRATEERRENVCSHAVAAAHAPPPGLPPLRTFTVGISAAAGAEKLIGACARPAGRNRADAIAGVGHRTGGKPARQTAGSGQGSSALANRTGSSCSANTCSRSKQRTVALNACVGT